MVNSIKQLFASVNIFCPNKNRSLFKKGTVFLDYVQSIG
jgi:hypothetical protein